MREGASAEEKRVLVQERDFLTTFGERFEFLRHRTSIHSYCACESVRESGADRPEGGSGGPGSCQSYGGSTNRPSYRCVSRGVSTPTRMEDRTRELRRNSREVDSIADVRAASGGVHGSFARDRPELVEYASTRWPETSLSVHKNLGRITPFQLPPPLLCERRRLSHQSHAIALLRRSCDAAPPTKYLDSDETPPTPESCWTGRTPPRRARSAEPCPASFSRPWYVPPCRIRR
ncbi:hypothetical protein VNO77_03250 [Canavalia gladiata]|uniref:Uncharacterized protein n=1 Tax=Canavalia gladiata TaxID=3824 RepID=A0AAN9RC19_CANGL